MARLGSLIAFRRNTKATIQAAAGTVFSAGEPVWATDTGELFVADGTNTPVPVSRSFNGVGNPGSGNLLMPWGILGTSNPTPSSGVLALMPFDVRPAPLSVKAIACNVVTAQAGGTGTLNQAVIYKDNGTGSAPLVTAAGLVANVAVANTTTGIKLTTASLTLQPGRYWSGLFYYAGSIAPTTTPVYTVCSTALNLYSLSTSFSVTNKSLQRTGLTAVPTDGVAFTISTTNAVIVAPQAA